ncbi:trehalase-like [Palaemon carinicauda]|uniref:trehalase-like n=1 Tax=Palaemon carinicauda TaxID=392227 RepID=UPI0035B5DC30
MSDSGTMVKWKGSFNWRQCFPLGFLMILVTLPSGDAQSRGYHLLPPCDSQIYCYGDLLNVVQMARVFNDSKHFVDMSLKKTPNETLIAFHDFINVVGPNPTKEQVEVFVNTNFNEPGSEFEPWVPDDWVQNPEFLGGVVDPELQKWGQHLNDLWKSLGRKISVAVEKEPEKYSQIYVEHPVIVPGGRFREFYYWDSYWTIDGLLLSGMDKTVKGMLQNFLQMVETYGMVPNGGRTYYTRRSQPPYLIPMFKLYMEHTNDVDFLRENIELLEREFLFWENNRSVIVTDNQGKTHKVARYISEVGEPRPESYREDYELAENKRTEEEKEDLYVELKSGAESGWDYSTRWIVNNGSNRGSLEHLKVTSIAPVDLNSLLCLNAKILSEFYQKVGNYTKETYYNELAMLKNTTMAEIFWDNKAGIWYDFDIKTRQKRNYMYLSNIHPIWSGCYGQEDSRAHTIEKVITYLKINKVIDYVGGVPTSLENSGQQWDFPNAWAPLQHIVILGLYNARPIHHEAEVLSFSLAEKWIRNNWLAYTQSTPNAMFEKYSVERLGLPGGGGEYDVQLGFGWSNGVAMRLLAIFGDRLTATTGGSVIVQPHSILVVSVVTYLSSIMLQ